MTLLAAERSLLIRNKFRSVLQLRIQNKKQNEINADSGLKTTCPSRKGEGDQSEALRLPDDRATQTSPPSGLHTDTAKDRSVCGAQRRTKPQKTIILNGKAQYPTRSQEQQHRHTLLPENCPVFLPLSSDVFEEDISSPRSSSPPERHALRRSPPFSPSPGLAGDQLMSDVSPAGTPPSVTPSTTPRHAQSGLALLPATEGISQPIGITLGKSNSMATPGRPNGMYLTSQHSSLLPKTAQSPSSSCASSRSPPAVPSAAHLPRPQKQQEAKPKMRKLKYHPYIPPNQRATAASGVGAQKKQRLSLDAPSGDTDQNVRFSDAVPQSTLAAPATHPQSQDPSPSLKPALLPPNLVDLTVSELRQQLRKRGLPVSGTKPSLLQRLQPFQQPRTCLTPAPLCQLGPGLETFPPSPLLHPDLSPSSCSGSGPDSPIGGGGSPHQQSFLRHSRVPGGAVLGSPNGLPESRVSSRSLDEVPDGFSDVVSVSTARRHCGPSGTAVVFMDPATVPSETPSPSLPLSSSSSSAPSPLQSHASWRTEQELHRHELNVVCEIRERIRHRPRDRSGGADNNNNNNNNDNNNINSNAFCGGPLHPFLQQDSRCRGKLEADGMPEVLFTQVFCCQPCEAISQDLELPVQITASPAQSSPGVRSLEEELQEAIQRAQMDPSQSIDDILDEPVTCLGSVVPTELKPSEHLAPGPPASPHGDQLPPPSQHDNEDNFLSSPLCSSLLLELPPSPATTALSHMTLAPPPTILCSSPLPPTGSSRKRKAASTLDAADWLEMLTFGFRPLTPPSAPFVETDFGLDSDLNVNRVLDLMIEQW